MITLIEITSLQEIGRKPKNRKYKTADMSVQLCSQAKSKTRREVLPNVVQLGATLPIKRQRAEETWVPVLPDLTSVTNQTPRTTRCPKFKNLFEYNKHYNDKFNLKRSLWKIPSMGNNFLPFKKKNDPDCTEEAVELYRPTFSKWYNRLVHENTVVKSPIETSGRVQDNFFDSANLYEKKYILDQMKGTGSRERFARDEIHLPDVYPQCYTCRECQTQYTSDVYAQTWQKRNALSPLCTSKGRNTDNGKRLLRKQQHCDVLGERYCLSCIENRNKNFSLNIESGLSSSREANKIHYKN